MAGTLCLYKVFLQKKNHISSLVTAQNKQKIKSAIPGEAVQQRKLRSKFSHHSLVTMANVHGDPALNTGHFLSCHTGTEVQTP